MARRSEQWVVGLHGIQSGKELYAGLFSRLSESGYSLLAVDFAGFGESEKPEFFPYTVESQAGVVAQVLDQLAVEHVHLVGHSLGGMVGTLLLPELGERVSSFANIEGDLVGADCGASKEAMRFSYAEFAATEYDNMKARIAASAEPSASARCRWLDLVPAAVFYKTSRSIVEWSFGGELRSIFNDATVRRLFMYGSKNAAKAAVVSGSVTKAEVNEAGHFMLIDQPRASNDLLLDFIAGH